MKIYTCRVEAQQALRKYNNEILRLEEELGVYTEHGGTEEMYDVAKYYDVGGRVREVYN